MISTGQKAAGLNQWDTFNTSNRRLALELKEKGNK
jgi:hypothetical protein